MKYPKVTIAVLSWNRLLYLKATIESARQCIQYPNLEWIVLDNESNEPGLRGYVESLDWFDHRIFKRCSHADAMNHILNVASGDYLLLWPEDIQFTVAGDWMIDMIDIMESTSSVGTIVLDFQRLSTLKAQLRASWFSKRADVMAELRLFGGKFRRRSILRSERGVRFFSCGWTADGICGSGIPSLAPMGVWRLLGPWKTKSGPSAIKDSSLGAEEDMLQRWRASRVPYQRLLPEIPVAADIITDPTGCKAKVRGNYRFGVYAPPENGDLYYSICDYEKFRSQVRDLPIDFSQGVSPIGFRLPMDRFGEREKYTINLSVAYDLRTGVRVENPLANKEVYP